MTVGENIRKARKAAGITQKELAWRLNVTPSTVSQFENSENLNSKTIKRIAEALNPPIGYPFSKHEEPESKIQYCIESDPGECTVKIFPVNGEHITLRGKSESEHFIKMICEAQMEVEGNG